MRFKTQLIALFFILSVLAFLDPGLSINGLYKTELDTNYKYAILSESIEIKAKWKLSSMRGESRKRPHAPAPHSVNAIQRCKPMAYTGSF